MKRKSKRSAIVCLVSSAVVRRMRCDRTVTLFLFTICYSLFTSSVLVAGQWPSLFRGVVVANSALGVRIVSVEEQSQAALCDVRAEDVIVQINGLAVHTIDEFAVLSEGLKGKVLKTALIVLRNGQPRELIVHLYSWPLLHQWELSFVPEHDMRFAEPSAAVSYWSNLGRGFDTAGQLERALNAYLNALHTDPGNLDLALNASDLLWRIGQQRMREHRLQASVEALQQATVILTHAFDQPLTAEQMQQVKSQLQHTIDALHQHRSTSSKYRLTRTSSCRIEI